MDEKTALFAPFYTPNTEEATVTKIGGTYYEVTSRFNTKGRETILQQFLELMKNEELI